MSVVFLGKSFFIEVSVMRFSSAIIRSKTYFKTQRVHFSLPS